MAGERNRGDAPVGLGLDLDGPRRSAHDAPAMEMRPAGADDSVTTPALRPAPSAPTGSERTSSSDLAVSSRWFLAADPASAAGVGRLRRWPAAFLGAGALMVFALARSVVLRVLLPIALAAVAIIVLLRGRRPPRTVRAAPPEAPRGLSLSARALAFHTSAAPSIEIITLEPFAPFGVTLLTTRARDRLVCAITTAAGTFYVGAHCDAGERREHSDMLSRASVLSGDEVGLEAVAPDGRPLDLRMAELAALVRELSAIDPSCLDRLVLSDARGVPITLEAHELRVREARFDLAVPLEWRAIVFQEPFGQAVAIYQGTWVRQGASEVVLLSLLPSIAPLGAHSSSDGTGVPELDLATSRDLGLMQASPEEPPPADQRVAIDRMFMLPLRAALSRAPRAVGAGTSRPQTPTGLTGRHG
jgi:hypothetical protein